MEILSKDELIDQLRNIKNKGWIKNARAGNAGGIGNTLEDLLGIKENNLPIPNSAEWELKTQRAKTSSLTTLFHMEPSPRALKFVPSILLPKYGWPHKEAGIKYPLTEMSFRQTISAAGRSDRGFTVIIDKEESKVLVSFDPNYVQEHHQDWLKSVEQRVGLAELTPQPYWGFNDLFHKAGTKLVNCFYILAEVKKVKDEEYYYYNKMIMLKNFSIEKFLEALKSNDVLVDFDARTGHNHGTKFRLKQNRLADLYETSVEL